MQLSKTLEIPNMTRTTTQPSDTSDNIPIAIRAWERLRYARVWRAQRLGESTRDMWHHASPGARGNSLELPRPEWLLGFDAEKDTYERFEEEARRIWKVGYKLPSLPDGEA